MNTYLVCLLSVSFLLFSYDCQDLHIVPSPIAEVKIGELLTLTCVYTGNNTPVTVKWFLGNDTTGMIVSSSSCTIMGTPGTAYEVSRYAINCSSLTIRNIMENDIDDKWGCTVAFTIGTDPDVSSTVIKKATGTSIPTSTEGTTGTNVPTSTEEPSKNGSIVEGTVRYVILLVIIIGGVIVYI